MTAARVTEEQFENLWRGAEAQFRCDASSVHGPSHWRQVERNGVRLATKTGADIIVVRLFAVFHDARRVNEHTDRGHGARGAALAQAWRGRHFDIPDSLFSLLQEACAGHTEGLHHADPTVGTCWDADRLDLGRVGTAPDARFLSTAYAQEIARTGRGHPFWGAA